MAPPKPPLPNESAHAYHRRITAAEGVPEFPVVTLEPSRPAEHHITEATWFKLTLARVVPVGLALVGFGWYLRGEVSDIKNRLGRIEERLAEKPSKADLDGAREEVAQMCFARSTAWLQSSRVVVRLPNYQTRGQPNDGRIIDLREQQ